MSNPYRIQGPALISVSGGRTSGFMLRQIIDAHGGTLPADVIPVFCNTGREHEATLIFLREIGLRWCPIVWLEYRRASVARALLVSQHPELTHLLAQATHENTYAVVSYCTASRDGRPFTEAFVGKKVLPNPTMRSCSDELKARTQGRWAHRALGWKDYSRVVGFRYDEPKRWSKVLGNPDRDDVELPMYHARHTLEDVRRFWKAHDFDLQLPGDSDAFGNCDMCFMKTRAKLETVMGAMPDVAEWWAMMEEAPERSGDGSRFRLHRPTYRQMLTQLSVQGRLLDDAIEDDTLPCACTD